ncbi:sugar phosphate isomerase/epimerase family protein [Paenibacillus sp. HJGM_3]|uniref:sugar phosphate isomerase/epimerase family protein n=1 Tax=Paenibacillus sp. HJGM_3 TaxID=3379816 RepID=UPI00385D2E5D
MLHTGLLSITFRQLSREQIVSLVAEAGLDGIEWGGDTHVPPGNIEAAQDAARLTKEAGVQVAAYGSYYKVGVDTNFADVLASAAALGAPLIRVWAGNRGSAAADDAWWDTVIQDTRAIAEESAKVGIKVAFEFHGNTLTDTLETALKLLRGVDHPNVYSYWQPLPTIAEEEHLPAIAALEPWLTNIHVYHWVDRVRHPLADGEEAWVRYLRAVPETERYAMLEFVKDDVPEQFLQDAVTLKRLVERVNAARQA